MKKTYRIYALLFALLFGTFNYAQQENRNKGIFVKQQNEFFGEIMKGIKEFEKTPEKEKKVFKMDLTGMDLPKSVNEFKSYWFNPPVSQGNTGTCWSFSTTSFLESEIYRIHKKKIALSPIFTVYWEYVEKTKRFIRERGNSEFGQGSESNAVLIIWKKYGIVPEDVYTGLQPGQKFHNHSKMFHEMETYLNSVKQNNAWNEEDAVNTIKSIMNHYIGEPPSHFSYEGKEYTPLEFLKDVVDLNLNDYVCFMSLMQQPYYKKVEYEVPDNWRHDSDYYNIPLNEFMAAIKGAIASGYTMALGGDVSEPGIVPRSDVAMIPTFDIPPEYIDENARQFRFSNKTTTDDHGIHLVGYMNKNGKEWFLIKDSGSSARNGNNKGFFFYDEDYVKLKMMDFMVNKDAVKSLLEKFHEN